MNTPKKPRSSKNALKRKNIEELIRHFILDHSEELFISHGYEGTSMDMIAQECGLSKPTLYNYFKNKYELFTSLIVRLYGRLHEMLKGLLSQEKDKRRTLEEFIDRYFGLMETKKDFLRMYFQEHPLIHENIEEHTTWQMESRQALVELLSRLLDDVVRPQVRKKYGRRLLAAAVFNMMEGLMSDLATRDAKDALPARKLILELLDNGVLTPTFRA
jgi:AcrR family transcriptional regulator